MLFELFQIVRIRSKRPEEKKVFLTSGRVSRLYSFVYIKASSKANKQINKRAVLGNKLVIIKKSENQRRLDLLVWNLLRQMKRVLSTSMASSVWFYLTLW